MFEVTYNGGNRLDIRLEGKLNRDEMQLALDELAEKSAPIEKGRMLYRVEDFQLPTLGAIGLEFARLPKMFKLIGKFERAAVLADEGWVRRASEIEGALIPGLQIKAFSLAEEDEAEDWLSEN